MANPEEIKGKIDKLREAINRANYQYHALDTPEITDAEYDGLMRQLQTVMFFEHARDPVLDAVRPASLRSRLVAAKEKEGRYRFDIRLQGEGETPFFDD